MLDPALRLLLRLRLRGAVRRLVRAAGTFAGVIVILLFSCMGLMALGPAILNLFTDREPMGQTSLRAVAPVLLLALMLLQAMNRNLSRTLRFTPAEVDLLFPAPFSWRMLLAYKLTLVSGSAVLLGLMISLFSTGYIHRWSFAAPALVAAALMLTYSSLALRTLLSNPSKRHRTIGRVLMILPATALMYAALNTRSVVAAEGLGAWALAWAEHPASAAVALPFRDSVHAALAPDLATFLPALAFAVLLIALPLVVLFTVPPMQMEAAAAESQATAEKLRRAQRGSVSRVPNTDRARRLRVEPLPWWRGVGPLIYRQWITALRTSRMTIWLAILLPAGTTILLVLMRQVDPTGEFAFAVIPMLLIIVLFGFPSTTRYDFRGDLDQIGFLKSLPIPPRALVAGQLAVPLAINVVLAWLLLLAIPLGHWLGGGPTAEDGVSLWWIWPALAATPALVLLNLALENALFLMYPSRNIAAGLSDAASMARNTLAMLLRTLGLLAALGITAAFAVPIGMVAQSLLTGLSIAILVLSVCAILSVPLVSLALGRFDPGSAPAE